MYHGHSTAVTLAPSAKATMNGQQRVPPSVPNPR
jgi:hypothetical protein